MVSSCMATKEKLLYSRFFIPSPETEQWHSDSVSHMDSQSGAPQLLSVEEKWQIIFNEKTRAPIYAVGQYIEYLTQFVTGQNAASRDVKDDIKKDGINPISYLLRKLKLDLKMSYDSFLEEFLRTGNGGMTLLVKLLKSIQNTETRQFGSTNLTQLKNYKKTLTDEHDCLLCIKYSLRVKKALEKLLNINYGLETVASSILSNYTKARGTAIEILTVALSAPEGFARILDCFTCIQLKIGEPVRFKSLMNMLNTDSQQNTIFKVSTMKFLNTLLAASTNTNIRVFLQHELETAGLYIPYMTQKASGTGLEYDDLRHELEEWKRKYVNVDTLLTQGGAARVQNGVNDSSVIEDLQRQVKKLSAEKVKLERQLKQVCNELKTKHEELRRRNQTGCDAFTQCYPPETESVGCQCIVVRAGGDMEDPLKTTAHALGWKDVYVSEDGHDVYYPQTRYDVMDAGGGEEEDQVSGDEGVVKVQDWLRSKCDSSDCDKSVSGVKSHTADDIQTFYFTRNSLTRRQIRKAEFPGNWKLIPKSLEKFPSRFPPHQCHSTTCDRCDIRNQPDNSVHATSDSVIRSAAVEMRLQDLVTQPTLVARRADIRSQSSDSAIGGSSGERLWNDRRVPLLPVGASEAEILQELIQPEDSASACPVNEPYPDYSPRHQQYETHRSYRSELSKVLREFEGALNKYELVTKQPLKEAVEQCVTLGEV